MFRPFALLTLLGLALPLQAQEPAKPKLAGELRSLTLPARQTFQIPYRLTDTKHVLVRAKINGKGPFNFILDTGAPALFVATGVCKKLGIEPDRDDWGTFNRFELEGGAVLEKIQGKVADPFQLEGMNRLGLAGVELHGVLGQNLLARFRIELDFTSDKMTWTKLAFDPGLPEGIGGKAAGGTEGLAGLAKLMSTLLGKKGGGTLKLRGFLGVELTVKQDEGVSVAAVLKDSPADKAGLKPGDRLTHVGAVEVKTEADVLRLAAGTAAGATLELTIVRAQQSRKLSVELGKGF